MCSLYIIYMAQIIHAGNKDIDKDQFLDELEAQYGLAEARYADQYSEKDWNTFRKATSDLVDAFLEGKASYRTLRGFDTNGILNAPEGEFDPNGLAAGLIGKTIRATPRYEAPKRNDTQEMTDLQNTFLRQIFGTEKPNINLFIQADNEFDENGVRKRTKRSQQLLNASTYIYNNIDRLFPNSSDDFKKEWKELYLKTLPIFNNDSTITDDEFLDLSRLTGISNIDKWFGNETVDETQQRELQEAEEAAAAEKEEAPISYNDYIADNYGYAEKKFFGTVNLLSDSDVTNGYVYGIRNNIQTILNGIDSDALIQQLTKRLTTKDYYLPEKMPEFRGADKKYDSLVVKLLINTLIKRNVLPTDGNGEYYIPNSYRTNSKSVIVYDANDNKFYKKGNQYSTAFQIYTLDKYRSEHPREWAKLEEQQRVESQKQGGTIRKYDNGGGVNYLDFSNPYIDALEDIAKVNYIDPNKEFQGHKGSNETRSKETLAKGRPKDMYDENYNAIRSATGQDALDAQNKYINDSGKLKIDAENALQKLLEKSGYDGNNLTDEQILDILNKYNTNVSRLREWGKIKANMKYGDTGQEEMNNLFYDTYGNYNDFDPNQFPILGLNTHNRLTNVFSDLDIQKDLRNGIKLGNTTKNIWMDNAGYLRIGEYGKPANPDENPNSPKKDILNELYNKLKNKGLIGFDKTKLTIADIANAIRLPIANAANNMARDIRLMNPLSLDPEYTHYFQREGFNDLMAANNAAGKSYTQADTPTTSNIETQLANKYAAKELADNAIYKGQQLSDARLEKSEDTNFNIEKENIKNNIDVSNINRKYMYSAENENKDVEAQNVIANQGNLDNLLKYINKRASDEYNEEKANYKNLLNYQKAAESFRANKLLLEHEQNLYNDWYNDPNTTNQQRNNPRRYYPRYVQYQNAVDVSTLVNLDLESKLIASLYPRIKPNYNYTERELRSMIEHGIPYDILKNINF